MAYVVLQQVSSNYAKSNAGRTLDKPIALKYLQPYVTTEKYSELEKEYPDGKLYIWGAKLERHHQIPKMIPGQSLVLFRRGQKVFRIGLIKDLLVNLPLAERLWGHDETGETWGIIYLMLQVRDVSINVLDVNHAIGRKVGDNWQGMTSIEGPQAEAAINVVKQHLAI